MSGILFRNANLVDATLPEPRPGHELLVEGDRIKEVSSSPIRVLQDDIRVIDVGGRTLMPGLIDAHVHVKASELDIAKLMTKPVSYLFAETAEIMRAMLMRGFTTVRDAAGADRGLADAVEHGLLVGPRLRVPGLALSQTGGHSDMRPVTVMSQAGQVPATSQHGSAVGPDCRWYRRMPQSGARRAAEKALITSRSWLAAALPLRPTRSRIPSIPVVK